MASEGGRPSGDVITEVERFLDERMVENAVPGLSVAVFDRDGVIHASGLGARNVEGRDPATPDTLFSFGSVTKSVTAMAVLVLVERGDLALEDEIREYVEYWNDVPGDPITVAQLLSHSSGMPIDYTGERTGLFSDTLPTNPLVTREDEVRHANGATDRRIPDPLGYLYSNRGYLILGDLVETVADRSHAALIEEEVFAPLGMDRSRIGFGEIAETDEDAMTPYTIEDGEPVAGEFDLEAETRAPYAAGGMLSSVAEAARLVRCLMNGGELEGARILDRGLVEAMCSHQAPTWETIGGGERGYGYGLHVDELVGDRLVGHTGTSPGVGRAYAGFLAEHGLGVTIGVNTADVAIGAIGRGVLAIAAGESPVEAVPRLSLREKIERVTGTYEGYRGGTTVTVEAADAGPHIRVTYEKGPDWAFPAFPESVAVDDYSFYRLRADGTREPVTFEKTDDGTWMQCNVDHLLRRPR